jgi:peroxiredoxin
VASHGIALPRRASKRYDKSEVITMNPIKTGSTAIDFTLKDQDGNNVTLSSFRGRNVILSFHPLAWTGTCSDQMLSLEKNRERFMKLNTVALGISIDHVESKKAWAKALGIEETRLLCDFWPHGEVARRYGVFREAVGSSGRANVIIDEHGKVIFSKIYPTSELPDVEELIGAIQKQKVPA